MLFNCILVFHVITNVLTTIRYYSLFFIGTKYLTQKEERFILLAHGFQRVDFMVAGMVEESCSTYSEEAERPGRARERERDAWCTPLASHPLLLPGPISYQAPFPNPHSCELIT